MEKVQLLDIDVLDNPANFLDPIKFRITFLSKEALVEKLQWKVMYAGSRETEEFDQLLDSVSMEPVLSATHVFVLEVNPPDHTKLQEIIGFSAVWISCFYRGQECLRIAYNVYNEYDDPKYITSDIPKSPINVSLVQRNVISKEPQINYYSIDWNDGGRDTESQKENTVISP